MEGNGCWNSIIVIYKPIYCSDCCGCKLVGNAIDGNTGERLDIADEIAEVVGITGGCSTVNDDFELLARRRIEGMFCRRGRSGEEPVENLVSGKKGY